MIFNVFSTGGNKDVPLDRKQFAALFDAHFEELRRYLAYQCKDEELATDTAQDAFVKLWEKKDEVKTSTARALLFTIGRNLMLNQFKRDQRKLEFINQAEDRVNKQNPEYLLEEKEFDAKLQQVINDLPEGPRVVFLLSRMEGKKYAEIAEDLQLGVKAVEKRMTTALKILREKLGARI